ncbi:transglutaminase domain-containing protein [Plastorhodobacter daqingensis]|uniref:Transglutaminase domain-containing protein n=1 Tax=Plastorhodobacter daqingensis TaxID=1387281 RepID=A0ABW2UFJ2_9RHOB
MLAYEIDAFRVSQPQQKRRIPMSYLSITASKINFNTWFKDTPLGLRLGLLADRVWQAGRLESHRAGDTVIARGDARAILHVVLTGRMSDSMTWYGPGNHLGSGPILHGRAISDDVVALEPCTVWSLDLGQSLLGKPLAAVRQLLLEVLDMLEPLPRHRPMPRRQRGDVSGFCDSDNPLIRRTAAQLRRGSDSETAATIWKYVQGMPYRFGHWQERASQTLARGTGMCTTKSNVQVALARACGLEAGFVEVGLEMSVLGLLIPDMWHHAMRPKVRHYFAAVRLDGRWHAADATFNVACLDLFAKANPVLLALQPYSFGTNAPFNPGAFVNGEDPFAIDVRPDLAREMSKSSRFEAHHFDSLNTRLDQVQGLVTMPDLARDPEMARSLGLVD